MEPMTLGSPVHPSSPIVGGSGSCANPSQQGFLPGFLMGDPYSQQPSGRMMSPTKLNRSISQMSSANAAISTPQTPPIHPRVGGGAGFLTPTTPNIRSGLSTTGGTTGAQGFRTPGEKQQQQSGVSGAGGGGGGGGSGGGGPPITGLYSNVGTPNRSLLGTPKTPGLFSTPIPTTPQLSFGATPVQTPSNLREEIPNSGSDSTATTWITVFGFPPSASGYILSQFSQYGVVLQHHSPSNGNWMHIKYQTKIQAQKALSKNGKILGGSIMIGVSPCSDSALLDDSTSETANGSVLNHTNLDSSSVINRSSIRPLTQAYKVAHTENEVLINSNTPDKNSGFVNKAMEYIFGW